MIARAHRIACAPYARNMTKTRAVKILVIGLLVVGIGAFIKVQGDHAKASFDHAQAVQKAAVLKAANEAANVPPDAPVSVLSPDGSYYRWYCNRGVLMHFSNDQVACRVGKKLSPWVGPVSP